MGLDDYLRGDDPRRVLERKMKAEGRLPPGQAATIKWPVLHVGEVPEVPRAQWDLRVGGLVDRPVTWSWDELMVMPQRETVSDFHCVTKWSRFDNRWKGIPFREVLTRVAPQAAVTHVMAVGHVGEKPYAYTTNIPLADLDRDEVLLVHQHDGALLEAEHGGPLRLLVPHLYAWKSAKWLRGLIFMDADRPGYWEKGGYHMYGDPFREQRLRND